jgi:tetratricopeptide (TPR) repeat protein
MKAQLANPMALGPLLGSFQNLLGDLQRHAGDSAAATLGYQQARTTLQASLREQPDNADLVSNLAWAEACLGDKNAALADARRAVALLPGSKDAWVGPNYEDNLARIEARFGDKDGAISTLQHLLAISYGLSPVTPALLRLDPDWDNLRGDPRFQKLCQDKTN